LCVIHNSTDPKSQSQQPRDKKITTPINGQRM
jgi:hypothetical protein